MKKAAGLTPFCRKRDRADVIWMIGTVNWWGVIYVFQRVTREIREQCRWQVFRRARDNRNSGRAWTFGEFVAM